MSTWMNGWMGEQTDGQLAGWVDGWMQGGMDGWSEGGRDDSERSHHQGSSDTCCLLGNMDAHKVADMQDYPS